MSKENVEFVKGLFAAASDMDKEALLAALPELAYASRLSGGSTNGTSTAPSQNDSSTVTSRYWQSPANMVAGREAGRR
jgi:hypothetical protein